MTTSPSHDSSAANRTALIRAYQKLLAAGLGTGASGNLSMRVPGGMLITPTGVEAHALAAEHAVSMSLAGEVDPDQLRPSSEWHMHAAVYQARPEVQAVVHCHSRYATTLACAHRPIPALHYMIAVTGSNEVPVAPYATFGTQALAEAAVNSLQGRKACLLANHGLLTLGGDLEEALRVAVEVEELAALYCGTLAIGGGQVLSDAAMEEVQAAFAGYGQQDKEL